MARDFTILETSLGAPQLADCPNEVILGNDVRLGFPELIGLEDVLIDIIEGRQISFNLEGIARCSEPNALYIDISFIGNESESFLIILENVTPRMVVAQELLQRANEANLLASALTDSKAYIEKLINSMTEALLVTNQSGKIKTTNRATQALFGYKESELKGQQISQIINDETFLAKASQQNPFYCDLLKNEEVICHTKTGEKRSVAFSCSVIQTNTEGLQDFVYIGRDITEHQRIQQRLVAQYSITRVLSESTTLKQATPKILQAICESLEWDLGEIWMPQQFLGVSALEWNPSVSTVLRCVETWGQPSVAISEFTSATRQTILVPGIGLPGCVWATGSPQWIPDVVDDSNFVRKESALVAGLHSAFAFPIRGDNQILGVMTFFSREVQTSDEDLLKTMAAIGSQIGQFIERKRAEEKLKEREQRLQAVMDNSTAAIFIKDAEGRYLFINRKFEQIFKITNKQIKGKTDYDLFPKQMVDAIRENDLNILTSGTPSELEEVVAQDDGLHTYFSVKFPLRDVSSGHPYAICGIATDITERKRIEEALHQVTRLQKAILDSANYTIISTDSDGIIQTFNSAAERLLGYTAEEVVGKASPAILHSPDEVVQRTQVLSTELGIKIEPNFEVFVAKVRQGIPDENEWTYIRKDGSRFPVRLSVTALYDEQSNIRGYLGIGSDITLAKQAEAALKESEERYRDLFENAKDLIQSVTADGRFVYVNRAWRDTLGYSEADIAEMTIFDVIHPNSQPHCMEVFERVMSGKKIDRIETQFLTKDGKTIWLEGNINCNFAEGKPVTTRAIFRDITKRIKAQAALRREQKQTERLLLNILPAAIADRLKQQPDTIADEFAEVTVMFADIVGFTELSAQTSPTQLVGLLNAIFSEFDRLAELHGLEKIKTIGDAYMVVGGLPVPQRNHAQAIAEMALDMQAAIADFCNKTGKALSIRIGINTGPVVAGVIGIKKFSYDLWGDTVNTASRMESHGLAGQIQVSAVTYEHLREHYLLKKRGTIQVKGKGEMTTYFLIDRKE
ncbi:MAG: PAS domain S-box protein [Coleofasciculus sp. S288]|nr:PAS domain S-box protein [Coleofasciculus sp. S288]